MCVAGVLLGTQIAQLGLVARTFGAAQLGDPDPLLSRLYSRFRLEHALVGGTALLGTAIAILVAVFASWASDGYAALRHDHPALVGLALAGLGVQVIFTAFLVSIVGRPVAVSIAPPIEPAWTHVEDGEPTLVP